MALNFADRVKETTATTGTGTLNLAGAVTQFQTFLAGIGTTNTCYYAITSGNGTDWEVGIGTVTSGSPNTLSRDTVLASSNSNAKISLTGTSTVWCDVPAAVVTPAGQRTFTNHGVLIGQGATAIAATAAGSTGQVLTSNGASADPTFQAAGGGALVLITETVTSASAASVTFSSIAATYRHLEILINGRGTTAALVVTLAVQFNGDTAGNYDYEDAHWFGAGTSFGQTTAAAQIIFANITGSTATANSAAVAKATIFDYRGTTFFKQLDAQWGATAAASANTVGGGHGSGLWHSTTAINAVKIFPTAGNFVDGSVVSLYGRM